MRLLLWIDEDHFRTHVQVIFNDGAGVFAPPGANSTARLESWPTSALEHFLVMLHHQLEMVRNFMVCIVVFMNHYPID